MKILVTGGAGFIGSHVVEAYIEAGHHVCVLDDLSTGKLDNLTDEAEFVEADIRDSKAVGAVFESFEPDVVNHHAAQIDIRRSVAEPMFDVDVNVAGTINLLRHSVECKVAGMIFASSGGAIYGETPRPAAETTPKAPISPYGAAKVAAEQYLFAYRHTFDLRSIALRYGNVYGPRQDPMGEAGVVAIFSNSLDSGRTPSIYGTGEQVRDYVYVGDVARANMLATDYLGNVGLPATPDDQAFNIGTGKSLSVNELYRHLRSAMRSTNDPLYEDARPGELDESRLSIKKAEDTLGFLPSVFFDEGVEDVVRWIHSSA